MPFPNDYLCQLSELGLIQITGEERQTFLQGQVTSDINSLNKHHAQLSCHCDFKGKTWNCFQVVDYQDALLLIANQQANQISVEQLKKYGVFSKIQIDDASADWQILGGFGDDVEHLIAEFFGDIPFEHQQVFQNDNGIVICLTQPQPRFLILLRPSVSQDWLQRYQQALASNHIWQLLDIQAGIAQISQATSNEFVPQMLNMHLLNAISFDKGCYMGQEVVARTKYLGKNKRSCFVLKAEQDVSLQAGDILESQAGDNWRRGGIVINHVQYQNQTWLLAVLASDTEDQAVLRSKEQPEQHFRVHPLPYPLDNQ